MCRTISANLYTQTGAHDVHLFAGDMGNYTQLNEWMTDLCIPRVREITFENAEQLTEEGLPFLLLFKKSNDDESLKLFQQVRFFWVCTCDDNWIYRKSCVNWAT